jgi:hypothetical protein
MQWIQRPRVRPKKTYVLVAGGVLIGTALLQLCKSRLDQGQQVNCDHKQTWRVLNSLLGLRTSGNNSNAIAQWMSRTDLLGGEHADLSSISGACGCDKIPNQWGVDVRRGDKPVAREWVNWIARIALDVSARQFGLHY